MNFSDYIQQQMLEYANDLKRIALNSDLEASYRRATPSVKRFSKWENGKWNNHNIVFISENRERDIEEAKTTLREYELLNYPKLMKFFEKNKRKKRKKIP